MSLIRTELTDDLTDTLAFLAEISTDIVKRGREKLSATTSIAGKNIQLENIWYIKDGVEVTFIDAYSCSDITLIRLSIPEICMPPEDWSDYLFNLRKAIKEEKDRKYLAEEEEQQKRKKAQYLKLKKEFEP